MKLEKCVCCDGDLTQVLDWGVMPLANNYSVKEKFPLKLNLCKECFHLQLDESVDPKVLFSDYPYHSGTSKTSLDFFKEFAETTLRYFPEAKTVLDIACNDGAQLDAFKSLGLLTYGIDPAENLLPISKGKGHNVHCGMFPDPKQLKLSYDIITAQNVVAHVPNPLEFLKGCKEIMHDGSYLFVATSQANMIKGVEFDTIYHEHISYFNTESMSRLCKRAGLHLVDVFTHSIHGTSYIFVIKRHPEVDPVKQRIYQEEKAGLYEKETYKEWVEACKVKASLTKTEIEDYRKQGYKIIGCGAAAKGITFLNMTQTKVDFIVDTTPAKWYGEAAGVPIYPFEYLRTITDEKCLYIVLAWNFEIEIKENILKFRNNEKDVFTTTNKK